MSFQPLLGRAQFERCNDKEMTHQYDDSSYEHPRQIPGAREKAQGPQRPIPAAHGPTLQPHLPIERVDEGARLVTWPALVEAEREEEEGATEGEGEEAVCVQEAGREQEIRYTHLDPGVVLGVGARVEQGVPEHPDTPEEDCEGAHGDLDDQVESPCLQQTDACVVSCHGCDHVRETR